VAATWTPAVAPSIPVAADINPFRIKGWALFAQPFFCLLYLFEYKKTKVISFLVKQDGKVDCCGPEWY
jgi:hypothetical protein